MRGKFITIEGPEGAGKTSALAELLIRLEADVKAEVVVTREPGGVYLAEKIRNIILDNEHTEMDARTEALLYAAARRQHLIEKVLPALERGAWVICDRFVDSSLAYQGAGRKIGMEEVAQLNEFATDHLQPDLTLYLDVDIDTGLMRIRKGRTTAELNRLDNELPEFHQRIRHGYLKLAEMYPERIKTIDARQNLDQVVTACYQTLVHYFPTAFKK